jgi:anti-anti-sigma factor
VVSEGNGEGNWAGEAETEGIPDTLHIEARAGAADGPAGAVGRPGAVGFGGVISVPRQDALRSRARADGAQLGAYSRLGRLDRLAVEMPDAYLWAEQNGVVRELQLAFFEAEGKHEHWDRYTHAGVEEPGPVSTRWKSDSQAARAAAWLPKRGGRGPGAAAPGWVAPRTGQPAAPPLDIRRDEARLQTRQVSETPPVTLLSVTDSSSLTAKHVSRLTQALSLAEADTPQGIVLDLSPVEQMDVAVIGLILDRAAKAKSHGGEFVLVEPQPRCFEALRAIGVPEKVRCFPTQGMAVDAVTARLQSGV